VIVVKVFGSGKNRETRIHSALRKLFNPGSSGWDKHGQKETKPMDNSSPGTKGEGPSEVRGNG